MVLGLFNYLPTAQVILLAEVLTSLEPLSLTAFINDSLDLIGCKMSNVFLLDSR